VSAQWSRAQVLELAPDAGSAKAGQGLARAAAWRTLGCTDQALWGEIQGSGKNPYQVRIDLSEPAFKCSCPSRKFPCKHGIGLLLIFADQPGAFTAGDAPDWVTDWLERRTQRTEQRAAKAAERPPADPEARAKRAAQRADKVHRGVEELALWLADLVRQGLGAAQAQPVRYWENIAARMVDAQAPGLARWVRNLADNASSGEGWQERMLAAAGRLHLLLEAYARIDALPAALQADVRTCIGWPTPKEELLAQAGVTDAWTVLGQRIEREEKLRVQRTWLWGEATGREALILQFAAGAQPFEMAFVPGARFEGRLVYFPSAQPLRAIVATRTDAASGVVGLRAPGVAAARDAYVGALAEQPWIERWPLRVGGVVPRRDDAGGWQLVDAEGDGVALDERTACGWQLLAISGGAPLEVFGEWDGARLQPMSVATEGRLFTVAQTDAGAQIARVA